MNEVTFTAFIARDNINDDCYPRTFLYDGKPQRKFLWYWSRPHEGCQWEHPNGKMGSYKLKELLPDLTYDDEPVEVEVTIKIKKS